MGQSTYDTDLLRKFFPVRRFLVHDYTTTDIISVETSCIRLLISFLTLYDILSIYIKRLSTSPQLLDISDDRPLPSMLRMASALEAMYTEKPLKRLLDRLDETSKAVIEHQVEVSLLPLGAVSSKDDSADLYIDMLDAVILIINEY